jgi:hypothetical protein
MAQSYSHSSLLVHSECPRNAEPPLQRLRSHFITAQAHPGFQGGEMVLKP